MSRIPLGIERDAAAAYQQKLNKRERKVVEAVKEDRNISIDPQSTLVISAVDTAGTVLAAEAAAAMKIPMILDGVHFERYLSVVESTGTAVYNHPYVSAD